MLRQRAEPIKILLVDDHAIVRAGLRMVIESRPGMKVAEAATGSAALEIATCEPFDIILLDLDLDGTSGLDFLPGLRTVAQRARVIALTGVPDRAIHRQALRMGAMGVVLKKQAVESLLKAIEKVHAGEVWLDRAMMADLLAEMTTPNVQQPDPEAIKIASLTERERDVITLICEGLHNKHISERMSVSEATVRHHLSSIFGKLNLTSRLELVIYAYRHTIVKLHH